jgi:hypothetical protein
MSISDDVGVIDWHLSDYRTRKELEQAECDLELSMSILRSYMRGVKEKLNSLPDDAMTEDELNECLLDMEDDIERGRR